MVRVASIIGAIDLLQTLGKDPARAVEGSGLPPNIFADPENEVPFSAAARILQRCAEITGLPHFGLLVGARNDLSVFGLIGHLAQSAPDVETAVNDVIGHFSAHNRGAVARLTVHGDVATISYLAHNSETPGAEQVYNIAIATIHNILQSLCGQEWTPRLVTLPRGPPPDRKPYDEFFGAKVAFGSEAASVSFALRWLRRPVPSANASLHLFLQRLVRGPGRRHSSKADSVRGIIRAQLIGGNPGIDRAAAMLGMHPRTLARRLAAEGATFRGLVQEVRFETADKLINETNVSISRIAELLGYSDQTAFSRAFSNRYGLPPSRVRTTAP